MNQPLGIALVLAGVCFLMLGMHDSNSYSSGANHFVQGVGGQRTLWLMITGVASTVAGLYFLTSKTP